MQLKEFVIYKKMNLRELADYLDLNHKTVYNILKGQEVKLSTAFHIQKKTKGKVKVQDMYKTYLDQKMDKKSSKIKSHRMEYHKKNANPQKK